MAISWNTPYTDPTGLVGPGSLRWSRTADEIHDAALRGRYLRRPYPDTSPTSRNDTMALDISGGRPRDLGAESSLAVAGGFPRCRAHERACSEPARSCGSFHVSIHTGARESLRGSHLAYRPLVVPATRCEAVCSTNGMVIPEQLAGTIALQWQGLLSRPPPIRCCLPVAPSLSRDSSLVAGPTDPWWRSHSLW